MKPRELMNRAFGKFLPVIDGALRENGQPFNRPEMLVPHIDSRFYGWTHYGVMIPDLPAPHRFFSIMSIIGTPGALAFDNDHLLQDIPRRNATVVSGTAATHPNHFGSYSVDRDCRFAADGSLIRFGDEVEISGGYPEYLVRADFGGFELDITIHNTETVTWFVKNAVYEHISLLSTYQGQIIFQGESLPISGLCTFEYGACISPYNLRRKLLPPVLKVPLDYFVYNIINLDEKTQLLLSYVTVKGLPVQQVANIRTLDGESRSYPKTTFTVLTMQAEPAVSTDGVRMFLPETLMWVIMDGAEEIAEIFGRIDTPFTYGLGSGYVGGYACEGVYRGKPIKTRGYIEYVDRRER